MASRLTFNVQDNIRRVRKHLVGNVTRATIIVQRAAKANVKRGGRSGFKTSHGGAGLSGSIGYEIMPRELRGFVGSRLRYARIQEIGGTIRGKGKKLSIPLTDEARKSGGPRTMSDLVPIPRKGRNTLLARVGENFDIEPQWVLVDEVTIPARPYFRPAVYKNKNQIAKALTKPMPRSRK